MKKILIVLFSLALVCFCSATPSAFSSSSLSNTAVLLVNPGTGGGPVTMTYLNAANPNTSLIYVQFFDSASAGSVTVGTTVPKFWVAVPANGGVVDTTYITGYQFKNGIVVAATTAPTGGSAPSSNCPIVVFIQ